MKLAFTLPAIFAIIVGLLIFGRAPDLSARMRIDQFDTTLTADLFGLSHMTEFTRYLTVEAPSGELKVRMAVDWGPARRTSIYVAGNNQIAVLGPAHDDYFISLTPLQLVRTPMLPAERWTYVGAFDLYWEISESKPGQDGGGHHAFRFFAASEQAECIPTLMDGDTGGPYRTEHYRQSCPDRSEDDPNVRALFPDRAAMPPVLCQYRHLSDQPRQERRRASEATHTDHCHVRLGTVRTIPTIHVT